MEIDKNNQSRSFQDLVCWKKCREIRKFIFELTKKYPKDELYALTQNTRRASYSITENIAEGYGRNYRKDYWCLISCTQYFMSWF